MEKTTSGDDGAAGDPNLYDGPIPFPRRGAAANPPAGGTAGLFAQAQPPEPSDKSGVIRFLLDVLSTRILGLVAVIAACLLWGFTVYEPEVSRTYAALGFSATVLIPIILLYWKRG